MDPFELPPVLMRDPFATKVDYRWLWVLAAVAVFILILLLILPKKRSFQKTLQPEEIGQ